LDVPEGKAPQLEFFAPGDPVSAEALRVLKSLTPEQESEIMNAYYPDTSMLQSLKRDELEAWLRDSAARKAAIDQLVNVPEGKKEECVRHIVRALSEKPEFAQLSQLSPEELAESEEPSATEAEADEIIDSGIAPAVPTAVDQAVQVGVAAKASKFLLTKEAWQSMGREAKWL